jgi:amidase
MSLAVITTASGATWQEVAANSQKHRDETIAAVEPKIPDPLAELPLNVSGIPKRLLTPEEIGITETLPEKLVSLLAKGELSATTVAKAFLRRAGLAQKLVLGPLHNSFVYFPPLYLINVKLQFPNLV